MASGGGGGNSSNTLGPFVSAINYQGGSVELSSQMLASLTAYQGNQFTIPIQQQRREQVLYGKWKIVLEPEGKNDYGRNDGGMIVRLTNGNHTQEVSRVAFIRSNGSNPSTSYEKQLNLEVDKARASVKLLNENLVGTGSLA